MTYRHAPDGTVHVAMTPAELDVWCDTFGAIPPPERGQGLPLIHNWRLTKSTYLPPLTRR